MGDRILERSVLLKYISSGELESLFDVLSERLRECERASTGISQKVFAKRLSNLTILQSRYKEVKRSISLGVIGIEDIRLEKNRISVSLVEFIDELPDHFFLEDRKTHNEVNLQENKLDEIKDANYDAFVCISNRNTAKLNKLSKILENRGLKVFYYKGVARYYDKESYFLPIEKILSACKYFILICDGYFTNSSQVEIEYIKSYYEFYTKGDRKSIYILKSDNCDSKILVKIFTEAVVFNDLKSLDKALQDDHYLSKLTKVKKILKVIKDFSVSTRKLFINLYADKVKFGIATIFLIILSAASFAYIFNDRHNNSIDKFQHYLNLAYENININIDTSFTYLDSINLDVLPDERRIEIYRYLDSVEEIANHHDSKFLVGHLFLGNSRDRNGILHDPDILTSEGRIVDTIGGFKLFNQYHCKRFNRTLRLDKPSRKKELKDVEILSYIPEDLKFTLIDTISGVNGAKLNDTKYWGKVLVNSPSKRISFDDLLVDVLTSVDDVIIPQDKIVDNPDSQFYLVLLAYSEFEFAKQQLNNLLLKGFSYSKMLIQRKESRDSVIQALIDVKNENEMFSNYDDNINTEVEGQDQSQQWVEKEEYWYLIALTNSYKTEEDAKKARRQMSKIYSFDLNQLQLVYYK